MSFFSDLKRLFSQMPELPRMARAEATSRGIPSSAKYVTIGPVLVLGDVLSFLYQTKGHQRLGFLPEMMKFAAPGYSQRIYYLVLDETNLMLTRDGSIQFSTPISTISEAVAYLGGGFVVSFTNGQGLAVATQTPVTIPPNATYRTVSGITNNFSGWDKELLVYGINCKF